MKCAEPQCKRAAVAKRLCGLHLHRWHRFGRTYGEFEANDPALRRVTSIAPQQRSRSGIRGVRLLPSGRWDTRVVVNGKEYRAGVFDSVEDAAAAVAALRAELNDEIEN
jgi:hypothetical protein